MEFGMHEISDSFQNKFINIAQPILQSTIDHKDEIHWEEYTNDLDAKERTSQAALNELEDSVLERRHIPKKDTRIKVNQVPFQNKAYTAVESAFLLEGYLMPKMSSYDNWYPPDAYMGWHTNYPLKDKEEYRLYIVYNDDEGSYFRWKNLEGEIETFDEPKGWSVKLFGLTFDPYWHCLYAKDNRFSVGFKAFEK